MNPSTTSVDGHRHGRVPRAVRSEQLIEIAGQLFAERGFRGTSMDELARQAGVSKPVIYDHFGSKEALFAACAKRTGEALAEQVAEAVLKESDPRARLRAGSVAYFRFVKGQFQAWDVLFDDELGPRDARFAAEAARIRQRQSEFMLGLMAEATGTSPDEAGRQLEATTLAVAGAYESLSLWWRDHPGLTPEELADWLLDLIWPGLEQLGVKLAMAASQQSGSGPG